MWGIMINKGAEAYNQEKYDSALVYFEKSAILKPEDTTAYYYAGIAAQQGEFYQKALDNYYMLIELDYHNEDIYSSVVYLERTHNDDNEKALEALEMAREHFPDNESLMKEEINLLIITEQTDEAKAKLTEAIAAEPDNANLYYNLAYISEQTDDDAAAVANYKKAIEADPEYFDATFNLAVNYYNKAAEILKKANDMDLRTYQKEGKQVEAEARVEFDKCLPYLVKAHELNPDDRTVLETLQTVYVQLKMNDKAEAVNAKIEAMEEPEE
jgi:tetratricopeptide (TPR) repeat protein